MRILHVSSLWPPATLGGAELYAARLADEQRRLGHDVGAVTRGVPGPDVVASVPDWPYRLDGYRSASAARRAAFHGRDVLDPLTVGLLGRALRSFRPDVVHTHAVAGMSVAPLVTPRGVRRVHHLHDHWLRCQRSTRTTGAGDCATICRGCRPFEATRALALRVRPPDAVVAVSRAVLDDHPVLVASGTHTAVLHLPADPPATSDATATGRGARRPGPVRFGFLGQLAPVKGVATLLEAFAGLAPGTAELHVAGRGELADAVAAAAERDPAVSALGWLDADGREAFFAGIDCLVVPSEWREPGGTVVSEARVRGLAVVATRAGGLPEVVDEADRALLVEPGDAAGLRGALERVAVDPAAYAPRSLPPTWSAHTRAVLDVYEAIA